MHELNRFAALSCSYVVAVCAVCKKKTEREHPPIIVAHPSFFISKSSGQKRWWEKSEACLGAKSGLVWLVWVLLLGVGG